MGQFPASGRGEQFGRPVQPSSAIHEYASKYAITPKLILVFFEIPVNTISVTAGGKETLHLDYNDMRAKSVNVERG
jgi:hypothetical protein